MVFTGWMGVVLIGVVAVFGYHLWLGWRTRTVRFPVSFLTLQEFEHDQSAANFWGIMTLNLLGMLLALVAAGFVFSNVLVISPKPINRLQMLDGCFEGDGSPDFMRPPVHWILRINEGVIFDRAGTPVSSVRLNESTSTRTAVTFSPGILISTDEHKSSTVYKGDTVAGTAYINGGRATITLTNDWGDLLLKTSCK